MTTDLLRSWPAARDDGLEEPRDRERGAATTPCARVTPGDWPAGLCSGGLELMHARIPAYALYGLDAFPADVTVGPDEVRVVEWGSGGVLATQQACMLGGSQSLGEEDQPQRESSRNYIAQYRHPFQSSEGMILMLPVMVE
jgi:hypothetical protein